MMTTAAPQQPQLTMSSPMSQPTSYSQQQSTTTGPMYSETTKTTSNTYQQLPATTYSNAATTQYAAGSQYGASQYNGGAYTTGQYNGATYNASAVRGSSTYGGMGSSYVYSNYGTHTEIPVSSGSRRVSQTMMGQERVQTTRQVSSTVIEEQLLGPIPQDLPVREVEVPGPVQEVIKHVSKKEVVETEKRVPRYEYEWVERIVEVPRVEYVDRVVEVPKYEEVIREVKVPQIQEVVKEVIKEVKVPQVNVVEKVVEVPGEIIEVPKPYTVEQKVEVTRYVDRQHPVVVAQTVKPYIVEGQGTYDVDVYEYEPECVPVDVHVIKAVQAKVQAGGVSESQHRVVTVPAAQYNTILQQLNQHLSRDEAQKLPFKLEASGQASFLQERVVYSEPAAGTQIIGLDMNNMVREYVDHASRKVIPIPGVTDANGNLIAGATGTTTTTTTATRGYGVGYSATTPGYSTTTTSNYTTTTPAYGTTGYAAGTYTSGVTGGYTSSIPGGYTSSSTVPYGTTTTTGGYGYTGTTGSRIISTGARAPTVVRA